MPFKKIEDDCWPRLPLAWPPCDDPEHNPPGHIVLEPGTYEYSCPRCGKSVTIRIPAVRW